MIFRRLAFATLLVLCFFEVNAQLGHSPLGARSAAMGHASVTNIDVWAAHQNQAAAVFLDDAEVGTAYESPFLMSELATVSAATAIPFEKSALTASISQFGYSQYSETRAGVGYGLKLSKRLALGVRFNYFNINFQDDFYGNKGTVTAEVSMLAKLTDNFIMGAHLYNPTYNEIAEYESDRLPVILRVGGTYLFSDQFFINLEVEKNIDHPANIKLGAEYSVKEIFFVRGGINTAPFSNSFGFGVILKGLRIDIASQYHYILGYSPQATLGYRF